MRATYFGLMSEIDGHLGRVFAYLKESGQWDDTLIVFTRDHGEQLGAHRLLGKIGHLDASFRIPMIIRNPDREADATRGAAPADWRSEAHYEFDFSDVFYSKPADVLGLKLKAGKPVKTNP